MEIAGLALGAYPALVLALEQYKKGAQYCQNWMQFRRRYQEFIHDTGGQQLFFESILQDLMCNGPTPFLTGVKMKDDFLGIVRRRSYTGWRDPRLKIALTSRLGDKYSWCMYQIELIYEIMSKLEVLLDIQALEENDKTPDWWKLQWERLKQALSEERYRDLKKATKLISQLKEMVASCDPPQWWGESNSKLAPFFTKVRDNAHSIHAVLKNGWHCSCVGVHKAMLQLERRIDDRESEFSVMLAIPSVPALGSAESVTPGVYVQRETLIKVASDGIESNGEIGKDDIIAAPQGSSVSAKSDSLQHNPAAICTAPGPMNDHSKQEKVRWAAIQQWKNTFRSKLGLNDKKIAAAGAKHAKAQSSIELNRRKFIVTAGVPTKDGLVAALETVSIREVVSNQSITGHVDPRIETQGSNPILDLCHAIQEPVDSKLGYLLGGKNIRHHLFPKKRACAVPGGLNSITLKELLEGDSHRFPPSKRAIVAAILASSLLQLQRTHWLKDNWSKSDIFFVISNDAEKSVIYEQPYFSQDFISTKPPSGSTTSGEIEDPPNFQLRTALQCLAILLIELCFGEPIERGKERLRLQPIDMDDQANRQYCLAIAHTWTEEEIDAHEPGFSDPVSSCLNFPDIGRAKRGRSDQVTEDVYTLIAKPLYDMTRNRWPNSFSDAVRC